MAAFVPSLQTVFKGSLLMLGMGVVVNCLQTLQLNAEAEDLKSMKMKIPRILDTVHPIRDALITFAGHKHANLHVLQRVSRRCASLLEAYIKVTSAKPDTVRASIITLGSRYTASILKYLQLFYHESDIPMVETDRQFVPINRELKHAHETLILTVECLAESLSLAAREKLEDGVAERV